MRCAACNEEYRETLDECPRCRPSEPAQTASPEAHVLEVAETSPRTRQVEAPAMTDNPNVTSRTAQGANNSTLIEFPGVNRNRPAWRKELSERFREIQQRRAREGDTQGDELTPRQPTAPPRPAANDARAESPAQTSDPASKQLGLVPAPDEPALNPIVAKALRRVERARAAAHAPSAPRQGGGRGHAATAAARVFEEEVEPTAESVAAAPQPEHSTDADAAHAKRPARRAEKIENEGDASRPSPLVVVQPKQPALAEQQKQEARTEVTHEAAVEAKSPARVAAGTVVTPEAAAAAETLKKADAPRVTESAVQTSHADAQAGGASRQPRHIDGVLDEFWLERQGIELLPKVEAPELTYDDRAPRMKRLAGGLVDLLAVAFLSAPFAAAIELTISNWNDPRVSGSMALIVALVIFLYQTCSVALAGRTFGMSLCALHAVDARRASVPTTGQCMRRAVVYILSLATFGLGLLYSLFDAEGRTVHDILSGTVVVRK
jgi:uncharacterized RDD family membrane protein YckC